MQQLCWNLVQLASNGIYTPVPVVQAYRITCILFSQAPTSDHGNALQSCVRMSL
jgi:hypothetical protein